METQLQQFADFAPIFLALVKDFPDFQLTPPLSEDELTNLENANAFQIPKELKTFFKISSTLRMNGLTIDSAQLAAIQLPDSEGLILGYFYLYNAADRLLLKAGDPAIYYLEQHNGAITKLAANFQDFLEKILPRYL